jgi:hypothetical protein
MLKTGPLIHGGIMINYRCTAACRHCLYACSPTQKNGCIGGETLVNVCFLLRKFNCPSVHIGGGEPFLDFDSLLATIRELRKTGVAVDYVETNAFWAAESGTGKKLAALRKAGADTLCISIDPFHAEYVPWGLPLHLARLCDETGLGCFLWKEQYVDWLSGLSPDRPYGRDELEAALSPAYVGETAARYGISFGGRAVNIAAEFSRMQPLKTLLENSRPCRNLLSTGHFHVDMAGRFIPPQCTGIALPLQEATEGIPEGKYPAFEGLYSGGPAALYKLAHGRGFEGDDEYPSACILCFFMRKFLAEQDNTAGPPGECPELDAEHYAEALKYY